MGFTVPQLEARKMQLQAILYAPTKRVRFENGVEVTYKDDAEIFKAIATIDADVNELNGVTTPRFIRTSLGSGYR